MRTAVITLLVGIGIVLQGCNMDDGADFQSGRINPKLSSEDIAKYTHNQAEGKGIKALNFTAGIINYATLEFDPELNLISTPLTLSQKPITTESIVQSGRQKLLETFVQGYDGEQATETFDVTEAGKLDILITVDNSSSMAPIQNVLRESLPSLLTFLDNVNWQIVVNTTTSSCFEETPNGTTIITKEMYDANPTQTLEEYKDLVLVGTGGATVERGILTATQGLQGLCNGSTKPWRREDAKPIVLIVTDELNCGSAVNDGCAGEPYLTADYMINTIPDVRVFGLLLEEQSPSHATCSEQGGYDLYDPVNYKQLISDTNGYYETICQDDYDALLQRISKDVSEQLVRKYALSFLPEEPPIVSIDGKQLTEGYTVENKLIILTADIPITASSLQVNYIYGAIPRFTSVRLTGNPDIRTLKVAINDRLLGEEEYSYDTNNKIIYLNTLPADQETVFVDFRSNDPLPSSFVYAVDKAKSDTLYVTVNDNKLSDSQVEWDKQMGKVIITPPPLDESIVKINYEQEGDRQTTYPITELDYSLIEKVTARDSETGEEIPLSFSERGLEVPYNQVRDNRTLNLDYKITYQGEDLKFEIPLMNEPLPGTFEIETTDASGVCNLADLIETGSIAAIDCAEDDFGIIKASYQYGVDYKNLFPIDVGSYAYTKARVYVNKVEIYNFSFVDQGIMVPEELAPVGAEVKILLLP